MNERNVFVADALDVVFAVAVLQHGRTLERFHRANGCAEQILQAIAGGDGAGRTRGAGERRQAQLIVTGARPHGVEHVGKRIARHLPVHQVVGEFTELVEDEVARILAHVVAGVVNLLHVAFGTRGANDVARVARPMIEPVEALLRHSRRQHRHTACTHDLADCHTATRIVTRGWPDGAMLGRVELPGDDARRQAGVGGQHLVCGDHRETIAEHHDDGAFDAGERRRQHDVIGHGNAVARHVVVPMHAEQIACIGRVLVHTFGEGCVDQTRVGELRKRWQHHVAFTTARDAVFQRFGIDHGVGESELFHHGGITKG